MEGHRTITNSPSVRVVPKREAMRWEVLVEFDLGYGQEHGGAQAAAISHFGGDRCLVVRSECIQLTVWLGPRPRTVLKLL